MSQPYICKKCGKEMWSFNDVVEYWNDIYCKHCAENPVTEQRPVKKKPIPMKSDVAAVNYREDSIREDKEAVHIKGQRNEAAIYKKGDFIGQKYEVFGVLGEGGFGIVYLVYAHVFESVYALKTFHNEYLEDAHTRSHFHKEAQVWIDLERHPYLVRAYFVDEISGRLFIAMEHIAPNERGLNSLDGFLKYQALDLAQSLRWAIQFCHGMEYAYSKGIKAHRDIKPANIMITQDKTLKISDFGLAGVIGKSKAISGIKLGIRQNKVGFSCQTIDGVGFGTPTHMPPEQFTNAAGCDERSDIYSFGVVLYQMASGDKLPFLANLPQDNSEEESRRFWIEMHKLHSQAPVPKLNSPLSPVIQKCLEKEPKRRYQSFKKLRSELEPILKKLTGEIIKLPEKKELEAGEWGLKGYSLSILEKHHEAIACFDRAININNKDDAAWYFKGNILARLGKNQEAIVCFDRAIKINPAHAVALFSKGVVLNELGESQEALVCYEKALKIDPKDAMVWNNKGVALGKIAEERYNKGVILEEVVDIFKEAISCYDKALEINPMDADAWYNKGTALGCIGNAMDGLICYDRVLEIDSMNLGALYNKARFEDTLGRTHDAIFSYRRFLELAPADPSKQIEKARKRLRELEGK